MTAKPNPGVALFAGFPSGVPVVVELGRHTDGDAPEWTEPFKDTLFIQRHNGIPVCIALNGRGGPEWDPRKHAEGAIGDVEFHTERYILRILEIDGMRVAESVRSENSRAALQEESAAIAAAGLLNRLRYGG